VHSKIPPKTVIIFTFIYKQNRSPTRDITTAAQTHRQPPCSPILAALSHCLTGCIIISPPVLRHEANYSHRDRVFCTFRDSQRATVHEVWCCGRQVLCARREWSVPGAAAVSDWFETKVYRLRLLLCAEGRLQG
jgi:hypothetical protein